MHHHHNEGVLGRGRGFRNKEIQQAIDDLKTRYEHLIFDHALNPTLRDSFEDRLDHAKARGRDAERFLDEEMRAFSDLEKKALAKEQKDEIRTQARKRLLEGESFVDQVIGEYRQRIEHYPSVSVHPDADPEICKLFGAMGMLDSRYWGSIETTLRRAFPQAGQLDRMSIEQRFWRLVPSREGRLATDLERYRRVLVAPSASKNEKIHEAQNAIKAVAFFLHDLLDVCERAKMLVSCDDLFESAVNFVNEMIGNFRLKDLKQR